MTGVLVIRDEKWVVKYDRGHEVVFYQLDLKSEEWSKKSVVQRFIGEGIEVDFNLVTTGEYTEEKESVVKEFYAKILYINHETINKK
jgi:hypothetical protein